MPQPACLGRGRLKNRFPLWDKVFQTASLPYLSAVNGKAV